MATISSQPPPANSANLSTAIRPGRSSSASIPTPSDSPNITAPSPSLPAGATNGTSNGFFPSPSAPGDGSTGADMRLYPRDGRVRNPVPSKLKNVNEHMKGNFGVMHMDVASHRQSEGRDAAAKRTSESTALQARLAQTDTYVSHQRRANYPRPPGLKQFSSPNKSAESAVEVEADPNRATIVLDIKTEQARLLTLLRSLAPHTVVDQICKALAFFGGIPDAPPPADGKFPESAESNGSGSLFIGWLAEIFPDLDRPVRPAAPSEPPKAQAQPQPTVQRRPRGRPKGSKASKARSDKGLKKGSQKGAKEAGKAAQDTQDDSWVDMDDSALQLPENGDHAQNQASSRDAPNLPLQGLGGDSVTATPLTGSTGGFRSINDSTAMVAPASNAKRRGRPKGSKNRPKDGAQQAVSQPVIAKLTTTTANQTPSAPAITAPPPKVTPVPVPVPMLDSQQKKKMSTAKAKPAKNRPKTMGDATPKTGAVFQQQQQPIEVGIVNQASAGAPPYAVAGFPPSSTNGSASQDDQNHLPASSAMSNPQPSPSQVRPAPPKKRKRPTATTNTAPTISSATAISNDTTLPRTQTDPIQPSTSTQLQTQPLQNFQQPSPIVTPVPPAKRARKSQEPNLSATTGRRPTPNNMSQKNSISMNPVAPEPVAHQSNHIEAPPPSQAPAEGLEAHFAAMLGRSDQMPSFTSRPQQQSIASMGTTVSSAPTTNIAPAQGLEAHYERFSVPHNFQDTNRQAITSRQQKSQQATSQTVSPIPTQPSKPPPISAAALNSQQPSRATQNYYSQTQTLGSNYSTQPSSYTTSQRPQHMSSSSPGTTLVGHTNNSPQFSAQSNSPLMQTDSSYRNSPSLIHNSVAFAPRRTPSASPLDSNPYRPTTATTHGVPSHSPHFGNRPTPTTTHSASHPGLASAFPSFNDSGFLDLQNLDSGNSSHGGLGLGTASYSLSSNSVPTQQRTPSSGVAPLYSPATSMSNNYLPSSNIGRTGQNRWPT
ncbi:hypothetical protein F5Y15DRAFT_76397 [Xylariaceae sp. FL0016]|nr:hypothetical protein F5Y15DRAFT_76397 [Xylariaceae sp. FL0016]